LGWTLTSAGKSIATSLGELGSSRMGAPFLVSGLALAAAALGSGFPPLPVGTGA